MLLATFSFAAALLAVPDGESLYRQHCASCHASPAARVPSEDALRRMAPRRIVRSLDAGSMMMAGRRVTPQGRRLIAEFLTGKTWRDDPPPPETGLCTENLPLTAGAPVWNGWSNDLNNTRFQPDPGFDVSSLPKLKLKWAFGFDGDVMAFGHPAVFGGRVFVGSAGGNVYSLDARTGCVHWRFVADTGVRTAPVIGTRADGRQTMWVGDLQSNLYALDLETGELIWRKRVDEHPVARITAAPALYRGRLYVPVSSFEEGMGSDGTYECCTFRGSLVAMDASSGRKIWQTWTIDRPARALGKNKLGVQLRGPSGVAIWSTPMIDEKRGRVYVTTGDNYTEPATPLSDAVIAMRLDSGKIAWVNQVTPGDIWNAGCMGDRVNCPESEGPDADFGAPAILVRSGGRDLLIAAQKSGVVYAMDPDRKGAIVWQVRAGKGGLLGGIQWGHATDGEKIYAPISDVVIPQAATTGGGLVALRIADGKQMWRAEPGTCGEKRPCSPAQLAAATVVPGAVFSGARNGVLSAYSTADGAVLWSFDTYRRFDTVNGVEAQGGSIDGPGPVIAGGMLFVNSGYPFIGGAPGNVLLAFGVDD